MRIFLVTGLPGTGKTTLARRLAQRYRIPLIYKDLIKERLLDAAGTVDRVRSRQLSDASFAALFAMAREFAAANVDFIMEGNFRPGEHEAALRAALFSGDLLPQDIRFAQILCRTAESERRARLVARLSDPTRHKGHNDTDAAVIDDRTSDSFLDLPGERWTCDDSTAESEICSRIDCF